MAKIEITVPGERIVEDFTALVPQPTSPSTARAPDVGLVELSYVNPTNLIPGPPGPPGPAGTRWYTGVGDPTITGAKLGDYYLDDVTGYIWTWNGTAWVMTGTDLSPDAGELLAKIITVDGAGSGLDADTLDGQDGAYYLDWDNFIDKPTTFPPTLPIPSSGVIGLDAEQDAQDAAIAAISEFPEAPIDGLTYGRKNAAWSTIVGGAVVSDTAPGGPLQTGQLWYESDSGNTYIWYDDPSADTGQWVQQNVLPDQGPPPPPDPPGFVRRQFITTSGAITLHDDTTCYMVEVQGGGGGGGACFGTATGQGSVGSGGGGGGYASKWIIRSAGRTPICTVAATVAYATTGNTSTYSDGVDTLTATGGVGGPSGAAAALIANMGGNAGTGSGGDINIKGENGGVGQVVSFGTNVQVNPGRGGSSKFGSGAQASVNTSAGTGQTVGSPGVGYGPGGSGGWAEGNGGLSTAGGAGSPGCVVVTEYR